MMVPPEANDDPAHHARTLRQAGLGPLVVLFILNAVDEFDRAVLAVSLDRIREDFELSDATVGLLPLAVVLITGLLSLPAGNWADSWSRRYILSIGAVVWGFAGLAAAAAQNFVQLFLTRALLGAGQGTIGPTHGSLLSDYYPIRLRGRALGYHRSANPLGQVLGAVIGGAIIAAASWRWAFVAAAIPGLLMGLYALRLREPARGEADLKDASVDNPLLKQFLADPEDKWGFRRSLGTIARNRTLRYLILTNAAFGFMLSGVVFWIPAFYERRYGFSAQEASYALAGLALCAFIGTWYGGPLADRWLNRGMTFLARMGLVATIVLTITWTIGFAIQGAAVSLFFLLAGAFITSLGIPGLINIIAAASPPHIRAQAFAAFGLALAVLGGALAPVVVGLISELFQTRFDATEGEGLRYGMVLATIVAGSLGALLMWRATHYAAGDVQRVLGEFIAKQAERARRAAEAAGGGN